MVAIPQLKRNVQSLKIDREVQNPTHGFSPFFWIEVVEEIRLVTVDTPVSDTVRNVDMVLMPTPHVFYRSPLLIKYCLLFSSG